MKTKEWIDKVFFYVVGIVFILGFFAMTQFLIYEVVPPANKDLIGGIVETMKNGAILILGYYYGSSKGSSDKNTLIQKQPEKPPTE
jgi:hypothetical protein